MTVTRLNLDDLLAARKSLPAPSGCRALRMAAGLSLADIAQEVGVSRQTIYNYEIGVHRPRGRYLVAYASVMRRLQVNAS